MPHVKPRGYPSVEKMVEVIHESKGLIAVAARSLGISRRQLYHERDRHPEIAEAIEEAREIIVDKAENSLYKQIEEGNTIATIFLLKTLGKSRGYIESRDTNVTGDVVVDLVTVPNRQQFDSDESND